jgi:hypothetical protein
VTPPAITAVYQRDGDTGRRVKTQRETDLEALDLAGRKGEMLGQLRRLDDGDRLDDASRLKVEWIAGQVRDARTGGRLDALVDLFTDAGIRARRWWQPRPGQITAGYTDEDDEDDYEDDDEDQGDEAAPVPALPAAPGPAARGMTWTQALAALGWRLAPVTGTCPVVDQHGLPCTAGGIHGIALDDGTHRFLCGYHHGPLGARIIDTNRARGIA